MFRFFWLIISFHSVCILSAQNYISIAPWDNALSYHPSIVGTHANESIQMNIFSRNGPSKANPFFTGNSLASFIDFSGEIRVPEDIKNSYFLGYQKTVEIKGGHRFTGGLQLQHYKQIERLSRDFTGTGFTINYHKPLAKRQGVTKYLSIGYQLNLLFHTPNRSVTSFTYAQFVDATTLSLDDFNAQFRSTGINQNLGLNYSYLSNRQTSFNFGVTFSFFSYSVPSISPFTTSGIIGVRSVTLNRVNINTELQQVIGNKFVLQLNYLEHIIGREIGVGIGFRLKGRSVLKFHLNGGRTPNPNIRSSNRGFGYAQFSLDMKRYKFIATIGGFDTVFFKLGVVFRFKGRDMRSLLSVDQ